MDIREEVDRELSAYADRAGLVMLVPEDRWAEFLQLAGFGADIGEEAAYGGARCRKAAVTAVIAQDGF